VIEWQPVDDEPVSSEAPLDTPTTDRVPLGRLLIDAGFLTQAQLDDALYEGSQTGERLGEVVVRRRLASEDDVARLLAEQWGLDYVERSAIWFDADALARLSREDAQRLEAMPTRVENGQVVVAVAEPTEQRLTALRHVIGPETVVVVIPKTALDAGLRSDLLASRAEPAANPVPTERPPPAPPPPRAEPPQAPPQPQPQKPPAEPAVKLAPVTPLPVVTEPADADAVVALANEARAVAERLAAQAMAVQAQQAQSDRYEKRIAELERELDERTRQLDRLRGQLASLLEGLGD
jgi:hypothetical protein